MDRQAQLNRLIWLSTTDIQVRKAYAWSEAKALEDKYKGICNDLVAAMKQQAEPNEKVPSL